MAGLAQNISRLWRGDPGRIIERVPLAASAKIYAGSALEIDAAGRVAPATKAAAKTYFGIALEGVDNSSGKAGDLSVRVRHRSTVHFAKTGTAVRGKAAYIADDNTVTDVAAGASKVGQIVDTDDDGVWVDMSAVGV